MFADALQTYFASISMIGTFAFLVFKDKLFDPRTKHLFLGEIALLFIVITATWADRCFSAWPWAWQLRSFTTFLNFAGSAISPLLLVMIYRKDLTPQKSLWFFMPACANVLLCLTSFFTGWIFNVNQQNVYARGPLFFIPFSIALYYMLSLIYFASRQDRKPNRRAESLLLSVIMTAISLAAILEVVFVLRFMIWSTTFISVVLYFLLLTTQKILYDPLTGVYSRIAYDKEMLKIEQKESCLLAVIDLDNLKTINDVLGHTQGDRALQDVVGQILAHKNSAMHLYRYGGDEFVIIDYMSQRRDLEARLNAAQKTPIIIDGITASFSYGIAEYRPKKDLYSTLHDADQRMYENKKSRKEYSSAK